MSARFNPFRLFNGAFVPNWLLEREEVSPGAKLLYGRLCQFAGRDGHCYPRQEVISESLGINPRQVRNLISELKENRLIETEQPGLRRPLAYYFLRHEWMTAPGPDGPPPDSGAADSSVQERQEIATQERQPVTGQERQLFAGPIMEEKNHGKTSSQNGTAPVGAAEVEEFQKAWNSLPQLFPKIKIMSSGRKRTLGARLKERDWRENYKRALALIPSSQFLSGGNERKWKAEPDWFLRPDTVAKILEGKYASTETGTKEEQPFWKKHL